MVIRGKVKLFSEINSFTKWTKRIFMALKKNKELWGHRIESLRNPALKSPLSRIPESYGCPNKPLWVIIKDGHPYLIPNQIPIHPFNNESAISSVVKLEISTSNNNNKEEHLQLQHLVWQECVSPLHIRNKECVWCFAKCKLKKNQAMNRQICHILQELYSMAINPSTTVLD